MTFGFREINSQFLKIIFIFDEITELSYNFSKNCDVHFQKTSVHYIKTVQEEDMLHVVDLLSN